MIDERGLANAGETPKDVAEGRTEGSAIERCSKYVDNRFELALLAAFRANQISKGAVTALEKKHKNPILSLQEIASGCVDINTLEDSYTASLQLQVPHQEYRHKTVEDAQKAALAEIASSETFIEKEYISLSDDEGDDAVNSSVEKD